MVATGTMIHVNNPGAMKVAADDWLMVYTQDLPTPSGGQINKPGLSRSEDGVRFSPGAGGGDFITVNGYPYNWTTADVNGGNVLFKDSNGTFHFYFVDMKRLGVHSVFHATSDGEPVRN